MITILAPTTKTYPVHLDPTVSLTDQIKAGNYGYVSAHFTAKTFRLTLAGPREVILYDPKGSISSETMIARMKADGFVPATLDDALAMGIKHSDRQKRNPIAFLGTMFPGPDRYQLVPVLDEWRGERKLLLSSFGSAWLRSYRFAAVREL